MSIPKFMVGDNTDFPDTIFIIHTESPRFILNLDTEEVTFIEEGFAEGSEAETANDITELIAQADAYYQREIDRYENMD